MDDSVFQSVVSDWALGTLFSAGASFTFDASTLDVDTLFVSVLGEAVLASVAFSVQPAFDPTAQSSNTQCLPGHFMHFRKMKTM